jgi:hypothetical protein
VYGTLCVSLLRKISFQLMMIKWMGPIMCHICERGFEWRDAEKGKARLGMAWYYKSMRYTWRLQIIRAARKRNSKKHDEPHLSAASFTQKIIMCDKEMQSERKDTVHVVVSHCTVLR